MRVAVGAAMVAALAVAGVAGADPVSAPASVSQVAVRLTPPPGPSVGGCRVFPTDSQWNVPVANAPLHPRSAQIIASIQGHGGQSLHPDFGADPTYGIPYVVVPQGQPLVPVGYDAYGDESDPGPFPVPLDAPVEVGNDHHVLVVRQGTCDLFELFGARRSGNGWVAASGARFDLRSNALRPLGWTSADAAGLPILPGLVRYDEVAAGHIDHAIRVTFSRTQRGFVLPATHFASSVTDPDAPPMGMRLRLAPSFPLSGFSGQALVVARALQQYGLIVADNGSNWFFQGSTDPRWDDTSLNQLKSIPGWAFEVVDTGPVRTG